MKTRFSLAILLGVLVASSSAAEPLVVAHRGLLRHAPENTLANFRACLELRLGFEFDVQRSKDGVLVCIHDSTVDRTTSGKGKVSDLTWAELQALDAGSWFDDAFAGERVPTVNQVLDLIAEYRDRSVLVAVDLKDERVGREVAARAAQRRILHRLLFIGATISSPEVRRQIRAGSQLAATAAVTNNPQEFDAALAVPDATWVYFRYLPSQRQLDAVRQAKKQSFIAGATVAGDLPDNWRQAAQLGMDAILTDHPLRLKAVLRSATEDAGSTTKAP